MMTPATTLLPIVSEPADLPRAPSAPARVTLVRSAMIYSAKTYSLSITPPLGLAYLAAVLLEAGCEVSVVDAMAEGKDERRVEDGFAIVGLSIEATIDRIDPASTVIGISCMFSQDWPWSRRLIRAVRERFPDALIVAGGEHISALSEYVLRDCRELDVCVLGEGEETVVELVTRGPQRDRWHNVPGLAFLDGEQFVRTTPRQRMRDVDKIPYPAWQLFPIEDYLNPWNTLGVYRGRTLGILATRGCPFKCTFCSNLQMYGQLWIARTPDDVLDEIEHYVRDYQVENIDFYDLTMIIRKEWILEFCDKMQARGLKITWQLPVGTRSETVDETVSAALYKTGCRNICYAPESGSPETLKIIKKQVHLDKLVDSIRRALRQRLVVRVNLIIGFPHETRRQVWQTICFGWKLAILGVQDAMVYCFSPYPGTELFDELHAEGKVARIDDDYFKSLVVFQDMLAPTPYCRNVSGRELVAWRVFGMVSFYLLSFAVRPWRFFTLLAGVFQNRFNTTLEFRLGTLFRGRGDRQKSGDAATKARRGATPAGAVESAAVS